MNTIDWVSLASLQNIDNIIRYSPYSRRVVISRIEKSGTFGYETTNKTSEFTSYGYMNFSPEKRLLKNIGFVVDDQQTNTGELPIIGLFLSADKIKKHDIVSYDVYDYDVTTEERIATNRTWEIIDIKVFGRETVGKKVFLLAPTR